ncbi:unnamed protein product [Rhizoctonia solani]|uniref:Uncharacterized protein n=1 Tax=Rhizoctonia solani TaxID=456999 RepID=A0A8H3GZB0_9AGAM|nr:unnamed protein product [Rhizoctonia solani]
MLRLPLDQLHSSHPDLASRLQMVINQLGHIDSETHTGQALSSDSITPEQTGQRRRRLADQYYRLLAQARQLPGLQDFLQPMKATSLLNAAQQGPIIVINSHKTCCDALLILPGRSTVEHLHLPKFNNDRALRARSDLQSSLRRKRLRERGVI